MYSIVVTREDRTPPVVDIPKLDLGPVKALVRTLRVGMDGTDHEVIRGGHGGFPDGESLVDDENTIKTTVQFESHEER